LRFAIGMVFLGPVVENLHITGWKPSNMAGTWMFGRWDCRFLCHLLGSAIALRLRYPCLPIGRRVDVQLMTQSARCALNGYMNVNRCGNGRRNCQGRCFGISCRSLVVWSNVTV
jgi:hypothetical protein